MTNGPALSTTKGGEVYVGSEMRDSLSLLDVLYANHFEGLPFHSVLFDHTEENFYRGAPPEWLNFYINELAVADGIGTTFIKRDGYETLVQVIHQRKKNPGISTVKLFHEPGCGGTTLAMQVLWVMRKTLRCAVLTGSTSDITNVAKEVVHLFTAGSRDHQNTVLLLLNDEYILDNLQDSIMTVVAEQKIVAHMPVVILFNCVRKDAILQSDHVVLKRSLSETEKEKFTEKKEELTKRYKDKCEQFHGFNIMQSDFSEDYVKQACTVVSTVRKGNKPLKTQLAAFLSLLNAYVPGSYLLESQCLNFLKHEDSIHGKVPLEDKMQPFSHLIVTFQQDEKFERRVCMAHPMIAKTCTELMAEAGVTRTNTARSLLTSLCGDEVPPYLLGFIKDMLTKREIKKEENPTNSTEVKEEKEKFSRLILDIQDMEDVVQSASVLKVASSKFDKNPYFPQTLARVYYIELKDFDKAEMWAKEARKRSPQNSIVADTLGQVHKNHLYHMRNKDIPAEPREFLQLATKAIAAFKHEEQLAENEIDADMKGDGMSKVSRVFNTRGQFGYLQVCNIMFDLLVNENETWRRVLTKKVPMCSVLTSLGDRKLHKFTDLIESLRGEVEKKCKFLDKYLTYSKPDMLKNDAPYISRVTSDCYRKYVGDAPPADMQVICADFIQKLKQIQVESSAGLIACLDKRYTKSELENITSLWEKIYSATRSLTALVNCILSFITLLNIGAHFPSKGEFFTSFKQNLPLNSKEPPEFHIVALLLYWPTDGEDKCVFDLSQLVQHTHCSYQHMYQMYFRSRYLLPLFFIGRGQGLKRIIHRNVLESLFLCQNKEGAKDWSNWNNEKIFQDPVIQERLMRVDGVVRDYSVYATIGDKEIKMDANVRNSLWRTRQVSFYVGFTIRGPVAFDIQTKSAKRGQHFMDRLCTALIKRASDVETILMKLKDKGLISVEAFDAARALQTTQEKMAVVLKYVSSADAKGKDALYEILRGMTNLKPEAELEESG